MCSAGRKRGPVWRLTAACSRPPASARGPKSPGGAPASDACQLCKLQPDVQPLHDCEPQWSAGHATRSGALPAAQQAACCAAKGQRRCQTPQAWTEVQHHGGHSAARTDSSVTPARPLRSALAAQGPASLDRQASHGSAQAPGAQPASSCRLLQPAAALSAWQESPAETRCRASQLLCGRGLARSGGPPGLASSI